MAEHSAPALTPRIWQVGALCRAIADALEARFNPVAVRGEVSGFSRAASGHCYFSLKDAQGQLRCAMFRRAAALMEFMPRDGELVEVQGRLAVYEPRGDLQLIVETLARAGAGTLFEQFLQLKARLEAQGLFDPARKRPLPAFPRAIGIVTSTGAAALHDVVTCLRRRAPHVPVVLAAAAVQGPQAPGELVRALFSLYRLAEAGRVDLILLVRGGGSIEDLWAFNEEVVARAIAASKIPIITGIGHEVDVSIADLVADYHAHTPTEAAQVAVAY
ncbi:MAG TPA: exodeoxyribonuclease VII large subunit, partial [Rudaea sp.]|nr:exodeoxyribonuclease VII large subunit [Rudaea sp.]